MRETFADEILIARILLHTHFFHYNPFWLLACDKKKSISRDKQYATAKLIQRTPVLRSKVFILFD